MKSLAAHFLSSHYLLILQQVEGNLIYFQLEGGEQKPIVSVMYHAAEGTWVLEGEETVWEQQPITEEEAMERIASFPRIPITMQPVKDYPMA